MRFHDYIQTFIIVSLCLTEVSAQHDVIARLIRFVTYNTGLTPRVPHYSVRKEGIATALKSLQADVICLQEVWFSSDLHSIVASTRTEYPYSFSSVHSGISQLQHVAFTDAPCMSFEFLMTFVPCTIAHCQGTSGQLEYLACAVKKCGMLEKLEQECITCLVLSGIKEIAHSCVEKVGNRFNVPGLLLLSRHPLLNVTVRSFIENKKLLIPRAYVTAQVDGVGSVACTHTTADLGHVYFENLRYASWKAQNIDEARTLVQSQSMFPYGIIMGDLNSGPLIPETDVSADLTDSFAYITDHGYRPAYVDLLGICTWCKYNPMTKSNTSYVLDHILTKNLPIVGTRRVFDECIENQDFPLSDHFGIEITVRRP